ncbi:MAG: hypothetical protein WA628_00600 [Terriglobales bacterium]
MRPILERWEVSPVLAHSDVERVHGVKDALMEEQAVGPGRNRRADPGTETDNRFDAPQGPHSHAEIDHHQIREG